MKYSILIMLLLITLGLGAVVQFGNDYIGPGSPGMWRKVSELSSYSPYGYEGSTSFTDYYYNQNIPTRLDSVLSHTSSEYPGGGIDRYEYLTFPEYYQTIIERWNWNCWEPVPSLSCITTLTYNLDNKITESMVVTGSITQILYAYDACLNLISETEYRSQYSTTQPYSIIIHSYDTQNRLIHTEWTVEDQITANRWQSWSSHSLPDSIYLHQPFEYLDIRITKHDFDPDGNLSFKSQIDHRSLYSNWNRTDYQYYYLSAHGLIFPEHTFFQWGYVSSPDAVFTPTNNQTVTYNYSNDYHSASFTNYDNYTFNYNSNWLMTSSFCHGDFGSQGVGITWEYYGPTPNGDAYVPQQQISVFPNPARHEISLRLPQKDFQPSTIARIYNLRGQLICSLSEPYLSSTELLYKWNCHDSNNKPVSNGIYLIRVKGAKGLLCQRVTVLH